MVLLIGLSGCAYYNTFYNAKKFYRQASKEREKRLRSQTRQNQAKSRGQSRTAAAAQQYDMDRPSTQEMQNYAKAIEKASAVLNFYPNSKYVDDALMLLGKCFFYRREYPKAKRKFEELIGLYPNSEFIAETKLLFAKTYLELNEYTEAEEILSLLMLDSHTKRKIIEEAQQALGDLFYRQQRYDVAADAYRKAARESHNKQNRALALYRLGDCLLEMKQYDEVPDILRKAVKESPDNLFKSQAVYRLGEAQRLVHDYQSAIKTFTKLMAEEMDIKRLPMVKFQLAESIRLSGDIDGAIKWYETIIEDHKRTDAAARSYFALGEIQEKLFLDFKAAKESYDKVRGEFANSEVVPEARTRSENIGTLMELKKTIAKLEGRAVDLDSTGVPLSEDQLASAGMDKDDARIDVGGDGMWLYYIGRLRPPPKTLSELSKADRERRVIEQQMAAAEAGADSTNASLKVATVSDSSDATKQNQERKEYEKKLELAKTKLQLAELLLLHFDMVDSALAFYIDILEEKVDTVLTAKALYSTAYIYDKIKQDSLMADSLYRRLLDAYPESEQANGARKALKIPVVEKVDDAALAYRRAEHALWNGGDSDSVLSMLNEIVATYPQSDFSSKVIFTQGWILENRLHNPDSAFTVYKRLVDEYPSSEYSKKVKPKIMAVDTFRKEQEAKQKAIADSIAAAQKAASDSTLSATVDSTTTSSASDSTGSTTADSMAITQQAADDSTQTIAPSPARSGSDSDLKQLDDSTSTSSAKPTPERKAPLLPKDKKALAPKNEPQVKSVLSPMSEDEEKLSAGEDKKPEPVQQKGSESAQQQSKPSSVKSDTTSSKPTEKSPPGDT